MSLIRISESDNWIVDYETDSKTYRVSYFEDGHFVDQYRFEPYEPHEHSEMKMFISKWFSALEDKGVNPWERDDCVIVANKLRYTEEDYKLHLNTIT